MYLIAFPDEVGDDDPDIVYLGVYLYATTGDFDEIINWPFSYSFSLELVDQQPGGNNISCQLSPPYEGFLTNPTCHLGYGQNVFVSQETLQSRCYIKDDCIAIRLTIYLDE